MEKFSVKKPYTVLVCVLIVLVLGFVSATSMSTDLLPSMSLPYLVVVTTYPGASPERVEMSVSEPMENTLGTVTNVKNVYSISAENYSVVELEFEDGTDMDSATVRVSSAVEQVAGTLPDGCGTPGIMEISMDMVATMYVAVSREGDDIYQLSDQVENELIPALERVDGIASVSGAGLVTKNVQVELNQDKIDRLNDKILAQTTAGLDEAGEQLDTAKQQVAAGQVQLDAQEKAFGQTVSSAVESQLNASAGTLTKNLQQELGVLVTDLEALDTRLAEAEAVLNGENGSVFAENGLRNALAETVSGIAGAADSTTTSGNTDSTFTSGNADSITASGNADSITTSDNAGSTSISGDAGNASVSDSVDNAVTSGNSANLSDLTGLLPDMSIYWENKPILDTAAYELEAALQEASADLNTALQAYTSARTTLETAQQALQQAGDQIDAGKQKAYDDAAAAFTAAANTLNEAQLNYNSIAAAIEQAGGRIVSGTQAAAADRVNGYRAAYDTVKAANLKNRWNNTISQIRDTYKALDGGSVRNASNALSRLAVLIPVLNAELEELAYNVSTYVPTQEEIDAGLDQAQQELTQAGQEGAGTLAELREKLNQTQSSINMAMQQTDRIPELLDTTGTAIGTLSQGQLDASLAFSSAISQLEAANTQLAQAQQQYETLRAQALSSANLDSLLSVSTLSSLIYAQNFAMPAGYIDDKDDNAWLLKIGEEYNTPEELSDALLADVDGIGIIRLGDVADITVIDNADESYTSLNGKDAIALAIYKSSTAGTNNVSRAAHAALEEIQEEDEDWSFVDLMDQGSYITLIVNDLLMSMASGALLAILVLALFLRDFRPTLIVGISIPLSVLFTLVLMYFSGLSLNIMTLSGLSLGVGMLVDNSIVVMENILRLRTRGIEPARAGVQGARQVSGSVVASTLTTICVFLPMIFTEGTVRTLLVPMALSITYCLTASLIVSMTVVPASASTILRKTKAKSSRWFSGVLEKYRLLLFWCLDHKAVALIVPVVLMVLCIWRVVTMGIVLIPQMDTNTVTMTIHVGEGTEETDDTAAVDQDANTKIKMSGNDESAVSDDADKVESTLVKGGDTVVVDDDANRDNDTTANSQDGDIDSTPAGEDTKTAGTSDDADDKAAMYAKVDEVMQAVLQVDGVNNVGIMDQGSGTGLVASLTAGAASQGSQGTFIGYITADDGMSVEEIAEMTAAVQAAVNTVPGQSTSVTNSGMTDMSALVSSGLTINVYGDDLEELQAAADQVTALIEQEEAFENISGGEEDEQKSLHLVIDKDKAMSCGITVAQIYAAIAQELTTQVTSTQITVDGVEMDVVIRESASDLTRENLLDMEFTSSGQTSSLSSLFGADASSLLGGSATSSLTGSSLAGGSGSMLSESATSSLADGSSADGLTSSGQADSAADVHHLREFATLEETTTPSSINRENQVRYMTITADTKDGFNTTVASRDIERSLAQLNQNLPSGYSARLGGETTQVDEMLTQMSRMLLLALIFVYLVMVAQFQSFLSPFIIMFTIPLAFTGGMLGLIIAGEQLSMLSLMGFLVLMGTVVNNGIVFVDYTNQLRIGGLSRREALAASGMTRMRPILMSSLTTILAMAQMIFGDGMGSQMGRSMAIVIAAGLLYSTFMTLFVVPVMYDIFYKKQPLNVVIGEDIDDAPDDAADYIRQRQQMKPSK